jgi:alpha-ketoglutarate-dependent 2,4-dichlorophenoxyacetate dioxygenase
MPDLSSLWHSRALAAPDVFTAPLPSELAAKPPAFHRLVQRGPDGRKVLYLAAHAKLVVGWGLEESQKLIWELIHHCTQPKVSSGIHIHTHGCLLTGKYVFSMEWMGAGDMVWWDNRQSMHRSNLYTPTMTARDVRRTTVIDDGPLAWGVPKEER